MSHYLDAWRRALGPSREAYKKRVATWERKISACLEFDPDLYKGSEPVASQGQALGLDGLSEEDAATLSGLPFGVKANIAAKGFEMNCGSKMLKGVKAPYSATAVARLAACGARPVCATNLDEFGMGSSTDNSALQKTNNPWDTERVAGGSSGGSAAAVAAGIVPFALGSDTGGSVRQPASFCGVYGLKPTYGSVSRFGLVAYASSLDVIGALAKDLGVLSSVYRAMRGVDPMDQTSVAHPDLRGFGPSSNVATVAVLKGLSGLEPEVEGAYGDCLASLAAAGVRVKEISLSSLEYAVPAYYTIAAAEASANLARYNGIRYGLRPYYAESPEELVVKARSQGFGPEVKLRIMLGTFVLRSGFQEQYYAKAQRIRAAIRDQVSDCFGAADLIALPVFPTRAFRHGDDGMDAFAQKQADKFTVTANLTGLPALSVPMGLRGGLPVGMQFIAPAFGEERLFSAARLLAKAFPAVDCPGSDLDWSQS